jgi:amino acid transporter
LERDKVPVTAPKSAEDPDAPPPTFGGRMRRVLIGKPRDLRDQSLFHRLALIPFLAWVGLGADGLSSSAYGPEEAFRALGEHTYLALALMLLVAITVLLISAAYSRIIEEFPSGGGGYVVATKLLGERAGVVSGSALLVDYVLTITTSLAAAGDALFSFMPPSWVAAKLPIEIAFIALLTILNIRGVRESVMALLPIFLVFLVTHLLIIGGGILGHLPELATTSQTIRAGYAHGVSTLGMGGLALLLVRAYSLGGGTYTGIEAVSNGLPIMREPRVRTGKRTMLYMAASLAFTASGLLLCYLIWHIGPVEGKTMNAVLIERLAAGKPYGGAFTVVALFSEAMLLVVAAQAGFLDGPRVLANMAIDSWVPHRFAALSERLTTQNGIVLMGAAALAALLYTGGAVSHLIVMYSINVFLTFSLSMFAMLRFWLHHRERREWRRRLVLFGVGFALCATILGIMLFERFGQGGWVTVVVTTLLIAACFWIRRHYRTAGAKTAELYRSLGELPEAQMPAPGTSAGPLDSKKPTAAVLVSSYGGVGIHTVLNIFRAFPGYFHNLVFISVAVIDSGEFKGEHGVEELGKRTEEMLARYVALACKLGIPATARMAVGTEVVAEAERLCLELARDFPRTTFFAGKVIFQRETWWRRVLHNETALAVQKRLQWAGKTMVTLPIRVAER